MSIYIQILLQTPEPVTIDPPTDRITVRVEGVSDTPDGGDEAFTHQAHGPVKGSVASDVLLRAIDAAEANQTLLFPLAGYEWIEIFRDVPAVLRFIRRVEAGSVVMRSALALRTFLTEPSRAPAPQVVASLHTLGRACEPFVPPRLVPSQPGEPPAAGIELPSPGNGQGRRSAADDTAFKAGVAQIHDDLDASHQLAQSIEGHPDGDFWHAIMHRREPDYGNSKYWFRHVGRHPVFAELAPRAAEILNDAPPEASREWTKRLKVDSGWDPFAFVDLCEQAASDEDSDLGRTARRIQWLEMLLLLRHCTRST